MKLAPSNFSVCLATPNQSALSLGAGYVRSMRHAVFELETRNAKVTFADSIPDTIVVDARERISHEQDLVRTRSRLLRLYDERAKSEWLGWWDDDVSIEDPTAFVTMLTLGVQCDLDAIGAIVPRKYFDEKALVENVRWAHSVLRDLDLGRAEIGEGDAVVERAKNVLAHPLRYAFSKDSFAIRNFTPRPDYKPPHDAVWRVDQIGMGCVLMRRRAVRRFLSHLTTERKNEFRAKDPMLGGYTQAAFLLEIDEDEELLSEDNSMWRRWADAGLQLFAYIGPGADAFTHTGTYGFSADHTCLLGGPGKIMKP